MKNFLYIAILILSIAGCKPGIPGDIVQPDQMALILHDIHIADAYITTIPNPDSAKLVASSYYKGIYKKFEIDSALYAKSMDYYYKNPKALDGIYNEVTANLAKEKAVIVKADSIQAAKEMKKIKLKLKADSIKAAKFRNHPDSIKKRKADSIKKIEVAKDLKIKMKSDSIKREKLILKLKVKKRRDSIKQISADKKLNIKKKVPLVKGTDSLKGTKKIN